MALGISIDKVVDAKMGSYFNSIPDRDQREKIRQEYIETASSSIQGTIDEAESLLTSIQSTCTEITKQVPITIAQIASLVTIIDPTAKAAQLTSIVQSVGTSKDTLTRASSQLAQLKSLISQLGVSSNLIEDLSSTISKVSNLLNTIPI